MEAAPGGAGDLSMAKRHLKRLAAPRTWSIPRKTHKWAVRPLPGPHPMDRSVPLTLVVRDMLGYAQTAREVERILGRREVHVDGRAATDGKRPVGLMDVVSLPRTEEHYRVLLDTQGRLRLVAIDEKRATWKLCRLEDKTTVRGGRTQLNLHDGRNLLLDKDAYKTGTTLKLQIPEQKVGDAYALEKGNVALLISGKHVGELAHVESYVPTRNPKENIVQFKEGFTTVWDNVFVVGKKSPEIIMPQEEAV